MELPEMNPNAKKQILLAFEEIDGKVHISVNTDNIDNINEVGILLSFALEKMLEE